MGMGWACDMLQCVPWGWQSDVLPCQEMGKEEVPRARAPRPLGPATSAKGMAAPPAGALPGDRMVTRP